MKAKQAQLNKAHEDYAKAEQVLRDTQVKEQGGEIDLFTYLCLYRKSMRTL